MNRHLSPEQIDSWLVGERLPEVEGHLQTCGACADEVARMAEPLAMFGAAVRSWGEEQMGPVPVPRAASTGLTRWWQMGLAFAMLLLLIAAPVYRHRQVTREAAEMAARTAAQDEILLRQVEQEISRSVPAPLEPMAKLIPSDLSR